MSDSQTSKRQRVDRRHLLPTSKRYIDRKRLLLKVPLSYPSIWARMKRGQFPAPYVDGGKNFWDEDEVDQYVASLQRRSYGLTDVNPSLLRPHRKGGGGK
jgi:predicted DNA-binding transcriptional regulator AlpA